jgi:polar amino acid transport system substrate-binding protein
MDEQANNQQPSSDQQNTQPDVEPQITPPQNTVPVQNEASTSHNPEGTPPEDHNHPLMNPSEPVQKEPPPTLPHHSFFSKSKILFGFLLVVIFFLVGAWVYSLVSYNKTVVQLEATTPNIDAIKQSGKIVIGTDATFPPMEFLTETGEYTGYDIDLARRITEKFGVTPEFKQIVFDNFINDLNTHTVDIVISSVSITDERKQLVLFSEPYLYAGQVILTRKDNNSITSTDDLRGKRIAVQKGTTNEEQARAYTTEDLVLLYDDYEQATQALLNGEADAIFSDLTGAKGIIDANPTLKVASEPFTQEAYGIVFRLSDEDLTNEINYILNGLRQQGVLTLLKQKWLE